MTTIATPTAQAHYTELALPLLEPSPTNPRKHFDADKLAELADSIRASGVHQPILVRPLPGSRVADTAWEPGTLKPRTIKPTHEIVAGERRYRASKLAGKATVPVLVRDMTDSQVIEVQILENLQRDGLTEMEEADGYQQLMEVGGLSAMDVATKVGKSRTYVYNRLKLLELGMEGRAALAAGDIEPSVAQLLARIPDTQLQAEALSRVKREPHQPRPMAHREAAGLLHRNYMLRLADAAFDPKADQLCPGVGPCAACPNRTGANPDLFADVQGPDTCTNPTCYRAKEQATRDVKLAQARARGQTVIDGREARHLMPSSWTTHVEGHLRLDDKTDSPTDQPLRKLIGPAMKARGVTEVLVANPHADGQLIAVLPTDQVADLLALAATMDDKAKAASQAMEGQKQQAAEHDKKAQAEEAKRAYEARWRWLLMERAWAAMNTAEDRLTGTMDSEDGHVADTYSHGLIRALTMPEVLAAHLAVNMAQTINVDEAKALCKLLDLGKVAPKEGLLQTIQNSGRPQTLLLLLTMHRDVAYRPWPPQQDPDYANAGLMLVARLCAVDVDQVQADAKAETRIKVQAERAATEAKKTDLPLTPAAQAGGVGGGGDLAKPRLKRKTTAQEASANIAAALAAADAATQGGNEQRASPESIEAAPLHPHTPAQHQALAEPEPATTPAADEAPAPAAKPFASGDVVRITATGEVGKVIKRKKQAKQWHYMINSPMGIKTHAQGEVERAAA